MRLRPRSSARLPATSSVAARPTDIELRIHVRPLALAPRSGTIEAIKPSGMVKATSARAVPKLAAGSVPRLTTPAWARPSAGPLPAAREPAESPAGMADEALDRVD